MTPITFLPLGFGSIYLSVRPRLSEDDEEDRGGLKKWYNSKERTDKDKTKSDDEESEGSKDEGRKEIKKGIKETKQVAVFTAVRAVYCQQTKSEPITSGMSASVTAYGWERNRETEREREREREKERERERKRERERALKAAERIATVLSALLVPQHWKVIQDFLHICKISQACKENHSQSQSRRDSDINCYQDKT